MDTRRQTPCSASPSRLSFARTLFWLFALGLTLGLLAAGALPVSAVQQPRAGTGDVTVQPPVCPASIQFGETILCSIDVPGEVDSYTFGATAGDTALVRMVNPAGIFWTDVRIYSPGGGLLCERSTILPTGELTCPLPDTGTYTLLASDGQGVSTGEYQLYLQRVNNPGRATAIEFGETLTGTIPLSATMDAYTFTADTSDTVVVRMVDPAGAFWSTMRIYGPDGAWRCEYSSILPIGELTCFLPDAGMYTLVALDDQAMSVGEYQLYLQRVNNPGRATAIEFGETLTGTIPLSATMDAYTFTANVSDTILVRMVDPAGDFWSTMRIYGPDGALRCEHSSILPIGELTCFLPDAGTYTMLALDGHAMSVGEYQLYLQRVNNPGRAVAIEFGETLTGTIPLSATMDAYTFTANMSDTVVVRMVDPAGAFWSTMRIYGPDGALRCEHSSILPIGELTCFLPDAGTYTLVALDDHAMSVGEYQLYLQRVNNPGRAVAIEFGETLTGTIPLSATMDAYTFTANVSDTILVRMVDPAGKFWAEMRVYGPDGALRCEHSTILPFGELTCFLPRAGAYTLLALDGQAMSVGEYALYLQRLNEPGRGVAIGAGQVLAGVLTLPAQVDTYTFTGDSVWVRVVRSSGDFEPGIAVYDSAGTKVCEESGAVSAEIKDCPMPGDGEYSILVYDSLNGVHTGRYQIYMGGFRAYLPVVAK